MKSLIGFVAGLAVNVGAGGVLVGLFEGGQILQIGAWFLLIGVVAGYAYSRLWPGRKECER